MIYIINQMGVEVTALPSQILIAKLFKESKINMGVQ